MKNFLYFLLIAVVCCTPYPPGDFFQVYKEKNGDISNSKELYFTFYSRTNEKIKVFSDDRQVNSIAQENEGVYFFRIPKEADAQLEIGGKSFVLSKSKFRDYSYMSLEKSGKSYKIYLYSSPYFDPLKTENFEYVQSSGF